MTDPVTGAGSATTTAEPLALRLNDQLGAGSEAAQCPECGGVGPHWVVAEHYAGGGFWTCPKFYGEDGRRKPEHIDPAAEGGLGAFILALRAAGFFDA